MEAWVPPDAAPPHHTGHFFNILLHFRPLHWLDFSSVRVDAPINSSRQLIRLVPVDQEQFSFWLAAKALRSLIALVYVRPWTPSRHSTQVMCPELKRATLGFSGRLLIPFKADAVSVASQHPGSCVNLFLFLLESRHFHTDVDVADVGVLCIFKESQTVCVALRPGPMSQGSSLPIYAYFRQ